MSDLENKFKHKYAASDVVIADDELAYDGFFKLRNLKLSHKRFDGQQSQTFERELCVRGDAVGVLLYDPELERFAVVEQIRIGVLNREQSPWLLEIVAGMLDKEGEDKAEVARRETIEEAGLEIIKLEPMLEYFCSPGGSTEKFSLFFGQVSLQGVSSGVFGLDEEHEDICLHILDEDEVLDLLGQGVINNAMTIIALQWFQLNREKIRKQWL